MNYWYIVAAVMFLIFYYWRYRIAEEKRFQDGEWDALDRLINEEDDEEE